MLGTPTAAPPAWLTQKYPETLRVEEDGRHATSTATGSSSTLQIPSIASSAAQIAEQMAKRFGHNPYVIGWQIDNEYAEESFDPETQAQFQQWLKARYGTLDNLNARWTTAYWSETYSDWNQIPIQCAMAIPDCC